jgi:uncharacterized protein YyaL (SSP411 family)
MGLLTLLLPSAEAGWKYMTETKIAWRPYSRAAFDEAQQTARPLFVFVYADWCPWCRKYETETLETPDMRARLERDFIPVAVDYDERRNLSRELGVRLVPTTLLLTPDGKKLMRFFGVLSAAELAETLDKVLALWRQGELPALDFGDIDTCCPVDPPPER